MLLSASITTVILVTAGASADAPGTRCGGAALQAAGASAVMEAPFEMVDGRIYLQVRVNGEGPYRFLFDTGASGIGRADASLVKALSIPVTGTSTNSDGVNTTAIDVVRLRSLSVGGMSRADVEVLSRDYGRDGELVEISGIIGREFFADGLLVLDYPDRKLLFARSSLRPGDPGVVPYRENFHVPVTIGSETVEGSLDTGSNLTMHVPRSIYDRIDAEPLAPAGEGRRANTVFQLYSTRLHGPVRIGALSASDVPAMVSDRAPRLNIGAGFLKDYVLAFDQRSLLVALCEPAR
jgi:Aspartyl protease